MKGLIILLALFFGFLMWRVFSTILTFEPEPAQVYQVSEAVTELDVNGVTEFGVCQTDSLPAKVKIYKATLLLEDEKVMGLFHSDRKSGASVYFVDTGINTVAHEVSHFVDYALARLGINDKETEAYLQGYFTQCVYEKLN